MKYVFFGTPNFAAIILEKLISAGFIPEAVVCNPDKPLGRKQILTPPPVKQRILNLESGIKNKIKILQPEKLSDIKSQLSDVNCQLFIVAAYAKILPKEILEIPRLGTIGVHPSFLPKHRGATPIQTAILNGDEIAGTTIFLIDEKMDHGAIIANSEFRIQNLEWNYETLMKKLAELSADLLIEILPNIEEKIKNAMPQDESKATYTKKFKTEDAYIEPIDLEKAQNGSANSPQVAVQIERKIRALNPEPGVFTIINDKRIKLLESKISDNKLKLIKIQKEGKKSQTFIW